jgi:hypothetical protein
MNTNILDKFKPLKTLGKGSEGIIILTHNNKYTIKVYSSNYLKSIMFFNIITYLQDSKLPKTIYKSYLFTEKENSLNRYLKDNNLPNHFSYKNNNNLNLLSSKYKMSKKLFEVMKTYDSSLKDFIEKLDLESIDNQLKINIFYSLFQQGLITLYWLYMKKSIIHNDITFDNFFIQKTKKDELHINIDNFSYKIKLFGYYLVIGDFGYANSIELINFDNNPEKKLLSVLSQVFNPLFDINNFIKMFKRKFLNYNVHNIKINNYILSMEDEDYDLRGAYKKMIKSYISYNDQLEDDIKEFKKLFSNYMNQYIFSKL